MGLKKKHLRDVKVHCNTPENTQSSRVAIRVGDKPECAEFINYYSQGSHEMMLSGAICRGTDFYKHDVYLFLKNQFWKHCTLLYCPGWPETLSNPPASAS